jgi:lipopolysaccharide assembly protein A
MRFITWGLRLFLFFVLFAFALNNAQDVVVHWFFGYQWRTPLVIVVLITFALGGAFGVLAMLPAWWKQRRHALRQRAAEPAPDVTPETPVIRDGL